MDDYEQIRQTLAAFCQALDGRRFEDWTNLMTEDVVFNQRTGRTTILESIKQGELATRPELKRKHTNPNIIIELDGDEAHATYDLVMMDQIGDDPYTIRVGEYHSTLVRQKDGRWLFEKILLTMQSPPTPRT